MHLKNFSVLTDDEGEIGLSPAYDLVATSIALPRDKEELALPIRGKKRNLQRNDFLYLAKHYEIHAKATENSFARIQEKSKMVDGLVAKSFLPQNLKDLYVKGFNKRRKSIFS
jgi:serine/threonine-protein kinase HipA